MELLSQQLGNFNLSDNFYIGCDLSNEARFLEKTTTATKKKLRNKLHLQIVVFILEKGHVSFC